MGPAPRHLLSVCIRHGREPPTPSAPTWAQCSDQPVFLVPDPKHLHMNLASPSPTTPPGTCVPATTGQMLSPEKKAHTQPVIKKKKPCLPILKSLTIRGKLALLSQSEDCKSAFLGTPRASSAACSLHLCCDHAETLGPSLTHRPPPDFSSDTHVTCTLQQLLEALILESHRKLCNDLIHSAAQ